VCLCCFGTAVAEREAQLRNKNSKKRTINFNKNNVDQHYVRSSSTKAAVRRLRSTTETDIMEPTFCAAHTQNYGKGKDTHIHGATPFFPGQDEIENNKVSLRSLFRAPISFF
jgi:hypothetical protein